MLDMGFIEDIEYIVSKVKKQRQTMLFSATIPETIREIAAKHMNDPETVMIGEEQIVLPDDQTDLLQHRAQEQDLGIVPGTGRLQAQGHGLRADQGDGGHHRQTPGLLRLPGGELHGDLTQARREKVLKDFREGQDRGTHRHRRRRSRTGHRGRNARHQLRHPGGPGGLRAPHRPHRPRRKGRRGHHLHHLQGESPV